jgi:hypothetical protein
MNVVTIQATKTGNRPKRSMLWLMWRPRIPDFRTAFRIYFGRLAAGSSVGRSQSSWESAKNHILCHCGIMLFCICMNATGARAATVTGKIVYNDRPLTDYTDAPPNISVASNISGDAPCYATQTEHWRGKNCKLTSMSYNQLSGTYTLTDIPTGVFWMWGHVDVRHPFGTTPSAGDFKTKISFGSVREEIEIPDWKSVIKKDLYVEYLIRLQNPVKNYDVATSTYGDPNSYDTYSNFDGRFSWDPVPGATSYKAYVFLVPGAAEPKVAINILTTDVVFKDLPFSRAGEHYTFYLEALNSKEVIGTCPFPYTDGLQSFYKFRVVP